MNFKRQIHLCVAGMLVSAVGAPLSARDRQQTNPAVRTYTGVDIDAAVASSNDEAIALELTMPMLQQYYGARTILLRAMAESPELARQVLGAVGRAGPRGVMGLEEQYADIPAAVEATRARQLTVHGYAVTEVAFMTAAGVLAGRIPMPGKPPGSIGRNVKFLQQHKPEIATLQQEVSRLEAQAARLAAAK
jgi:hypothetical protein